MKREHLCHIISLLLIALMTFKSISPAIGLFSNDRNSQLTELLVELEQEEEKKGSRAVETEISEEVYEESQLIEVPSVFAHQFTLLKVKDADLQDVYLDTLTPPPNYLS